MNHLNPDFPYPAGHKPETLTEPAMPPTVSNPARAIHMLFQNSDDWDMGMWTGPALVVARACLREMLRHVEGEMGRREMIAPQRGTR